MNEQSDTPWALVANGRVLARFHSRVEAEEDLDTDAIEHGGLAYPVDTTVEYLPEPKPTPPF